MFSHALHSFRAKNNDSILYIDIETEGDKSYEVCSQFLEEFAHDDDEDIRALNDYITYGKDGEGIVNQRLLGILAMLCTRYTKRIHSVSNNRSYCNSSITAFERAESYLMQ
ncbi:MAG: hypothetical protein M0P91_10980 [Sulfuricurvum sp.]|jgi:hypothetical protein|uniref:hypothetical protein n=1 Tax=Sulfuricurvum sp. TaxID=2025608 RepID=UPI0025FA700C|nr:hypothetical protein [Sulfuricurvum sp.]MCK9373713.1 hypothetical protein [Sulfuricurvum sp.]